jgi:N6-adenosine-specific RNA methylase IME4
LLWTTDPFLRKSFEVIDSWGFEYKTVGFVWAKNTEYPGDDVMKTLLKREIWWEAQHFFSIGTGYWTRANPEYCLLATRGHPKRLNSDVRELVISPRREHSRKPDEMYDYIERLCSGPYLELFARNSHPGWDHLGLEADSGPGQRRWKSNSGPLEKSNLSPMELLK